MASNVIPEAELSAKEAEQLAAAIVEVDKAFPSNIDPRMIAVANLIGAAGIIYGPRIMAAILRRRSEAARPRPLATAARPGPATQGFDGAAAAFNVTPTPGAPADPPLSAALPPDGFQTSQNRG